MIKNIHFVGIKGVGMTPLAIIAKEAGMHVSGSDVSDQFITDVSLQQAGINPYVGFKAEHVSGADLVVTTGAHGGYDNPEVLSAIEKGIPVISMGKALGMFMDGKIFGRKLKGISVAGTHGKTTTTAMIATILLKNNVDASYLIGTSHIPSLGHSGHYGNGDYFVAEADEYATEPIHDRRPKLFWHHPEIAVITNIEHDHPDLYPDLDSVRKVFSEFIKQLPQNGILIANGDDHEIRKLLRDYSGRNITFGFNSANDYILRHVNISGSNSFFRVSAYGADLGEFMLHVPGMHNSLNALAAVIVGLEIGFTLDKIKTAIQKFTGTKRRLEYIGELQSGAYLYDDYGHHPTEISATLAALRALYPKKNLICIFQPHTYSRTKAFFQDFVRAFKDADTAILLDIYASAREIPDKSVSSGMLAEAMKTIHKDVRFLSSAHNVVEYLDRNKFGENTVIITMGAGDVYKISEKLKVKS